MRKLFHIFRILTVPPIFAIAFMLTVYFTRPDGFISVSQLICGLFFLGILPILGYPLQKYIPPFRDKGREGQRTLAMIFSASGYLLGTLTAFAAQAPLALCTVYLEYLLCGIAILIFNKGFNLKASGHACGIIGPVLLFIDFKMYVPAVIGGLFVIPVLVSSVKTKRHTIPQLIGGCFIAVVCLILIELFVYLF